MRGFVFNRTRTRSLSSKTSRRARRHAWQKALSGVGVASLITGLALVGAAGPVAAAASNACDGAVANQQNNLSVSASHGKIFYIDSGQGQNIDAAYVAYKVDNLNTAATRSNLWVTLDTFTGGIVQLANPADASMPLDPLTPSGASSTNTAFFLLKATSSTTNAQSHVVHVHSGKPGTAAATELYSCTFSFANVSETIKAAANKVTSVATTSVETLGSTMTVTVEGATGTIGAGNAIDGSMMWLSPAARSSWPTRALRLEDTSLDVRTNPSTGSQIPGSPFVNQLRVPMGTGKYYYTATYTFRIIGSSTISAPDVVPIGQIASGTQIKHTDLSNTTWTLISAQPTVNVAVSKSVAQAVTVADGATTFDYTITLTNTGSAATVDQVTDAPDSALAFVSGSATLDGIAIADASPLTSDPTQLAFTGPFALPAGTPEVPTVKSLSYKMVAEACGTSFEYVNSAAAKIGSLTIGSGPATISAVTAGGTCGSTELTEFSTTDTALPIEVVTGSASVVGQTSATIAGIIDPNGQAGHDIVFTYGASSDLAGASIVIAGVTTTSTTGYSIGQPLTGLSSGTVYYYRISVDGVLGDILSFVTTEPVSIPTATTTAATNVTTGGAATLNGSIDPNQVADGAKVKFQYGLDSSGGACTALGTLTTTGFVQSETESGTTDAVLAGAFATGVDAAVTGLTAGSFYCYKVIAYYSTVSPASWVNTVVAPNWVAFRAVTKAAQTITFPTPASLLAGDTAVAAATTTSGLTIAYASNTPGVCTVTVDGTITGVSSGTCSITASQPGDNNYTAATPVTVTFSVTPGGPTIATSALIDGTFGSAYSLTLTATGGDGSYSDWTLVSGTLPDGLSLNTVTGEISGTPTAAGAATLSFTVDSNSLTSATKTLSLQIGKAVLSVVAPNPAVSYGDDILTLTPSVSGYLSGDSVADLTTAPWCSTAYTTSTDAGQTPAVTCAGGADENYSFSYTDGAVTIAKAALAVTAPNPTVTYGDAAPTLTPSMSGYVSGESVADLTTVPNCTTAYTATTDAGQTPAVTCSGGVADNYTFSYSAGAFTIEKAPLAVVAPSPTVTFGDAVPALTPSITGFVNGETSAALTAAPSCTTSYTSSTGVGETPAVTCAGAAADNYSFSYTAGAFTIAKAVLSVVAPSPSVTYGDSVPALVPTITGYLNGDSSADLATAPTCSTSYTSSTGAGQTPAATCSAGVADNYSFSYTAGAFTIAKATLSVVAPNPTVAYGDAVPSLTPTITGYVNGDTSGDLATAPTCSTSYTSSTAVGQTPAVSCTGALADNYDFSYTAGAFTIAKAVLSVVAPSPSVTYGDAVPTLSPSITGYLNGDSSGDLATAPTCSTSYTSSTDAGQTPAVTCSAGVADNYSFGYTAGVFTIAKAAQLITATPNAPTDLAPLATQPFSASSSSGLPVTVTATGACSWAADVATAGGTAGTCTLTSSIGASTNFLAAADVVRTFEVGKLARTLGLVTTQPSVKVGSTVTLTATPSAGAGTITYTLASGSADCSLSGAVVTAIDAGECTVHATITADATYLGATSVTRTITVSALSVPVSTTTTTPPAPTQPPADPPTEEPEGEDPIAPIDPVVLPVPDSGDPVDTIDFGAGPQPFNSSIDVTTQARRTKAELSRESLGGFAPGTGIRIDVTGARTIGQFIVVPGEVTDPLTIAAAIEESRDRKSADFASIFSVRAVDRPAAGSILGGQVTADAIEVFGDSGLATPITAGQLPIDSATKWLHISANAHGYVPGSIAYLAVTTDPIIVGAAVVDRSGNAVISGSIPLDLLATGGHDIRVLGIRMLEGVSTDGSGSITLSTAALDEIHRFDEGTLATVKVTGSNESGGTHQVVRLVLLDHEVPWWSVWLLALGGLVALGLRVFSKVWSIRRRVVMGAVLAVLTVVPLAAGWITASYEIMAWGGVLGLFAQGLAWALPQLARGEREDKEPQYARYAPMPAN